MAPSRAFLESVCITSQSAVSAELIARVSCEMLCASDSPTRLSDPARSTRCSLPLRGRVAPFSRRSMPG